MRDISEGLPGGRLWYMAADPSEPDTTYAVTDAGLHRLEQD